jgi:hypothetical protein
VHRQLVERVIIYLDGKNMQTWSMNYDIDGWELMLGKEG